MPAAEQGDPQTFAIIGAAMEVHKQLGHGFLEAVYQEACGLEFELRKIPFAREVSLIVEYKTVPLSTRYRADFVCYGEIIVELKAQSQLTNSDMAQTLNDLKATGLKRALLLKFGAKSLERHRLVWNYHP
jgi:GxxExxY protein